MKVISGIARRIRNTAEVYGNQHSVGTSQILGFRIASQVVELNMPRLPLIEEGDEVVVAGDLKSGTLSGRAYQNRTTGSFGRRARCSVLGGFIYAAIMTLFASFGLFILTGGWLANGGFTDQRTGVLLYLAIPGSVGAMWWLRRLMSELKTDYALSRVRG